MRTQRGRRVTIADAMVLIAATTVGLAMARSYAWSLYREIPDPSALRTFLMFQGTAPCLVFTMMLALIPLWLRPPRPRLGSLLRQPGFAACTAGAAAFAAGVLTAIATRDRFGSGHTAFFFWASCASWADSVVPGSWLFLALSGRWRAQADWIDRLGRILGAFWILYLAHLVFSAWLIGWLPAL
jgi:hypothetical protein